MINSDSGATTSHADYLHEALGEPFWVFTPGGQMIEWNRPLQEVTGYSDKEIADMHPADLVPDNERSVIEECIEIALEEGTAATEGHLLSKDNCQLAYRFKGAAPEKSGQTLVCMRGEPLGSQSEISSVGVPVSGQLQQALRELPVFLYRMNRQLEYTWISSTLAGMKPSDFLGKTAAEIFPEIEAERLRKAREQVLATGEPMRAEFSATLQGRQCFIDTFMAPRYDRHGNITGLVGASVEVTDRKRTEEKRLAAERKYHRLFEEAQEGIAITTPAGEILEANPAALEMTGYRREELEAVKVQNLYANVRERRDILTTLAEEGAVRSREVRILRKDGREIICQMSTTARTTPEGEVEAYQTLFRDVTEAVRAREALKESEEKFRTIAENTPVGISLVQDGIFKYVNPAYGEIFGYETDELLGRSPKMIVADQQWPRVREQLRKRLEASETSVRYEFTGRTKDGQRRYVEVFGGCITYEGRPAPIGTVVDITGRRRLQQQILEIQEEERQRIGQELHDGIASQLTGLDMILGAIIRQMEKGQSPRPSELRKLRTFIKDAAQQTRQISHGLNPVTIDRGGLPEALRELADLTQQRSQAACHYDGPQELPDNISVEVLTHLYRIAQEAVNNAAKHAEGEHIWIRLSISGDEVVLCIADDGVGLPDDWETEAGIGVQTMRYRTNLLGGTMTIAGPSGGGTQLLVHAPVRPLT